MALFEWGVAVHDLDFEAIRTGEKSKEQVREELKGIAGKARTQIVKDYIAFPALSGLIMGGIAAAAEAVRQQPGAEAAGAEPACAAGCRPGCAAACPQSSPARAVADAWLAEFKRSYRSTLWADVTANVVRNFWSNAIIFCGHFPDQTYTFSEEEVEDETKGGWYVRQLLGAANIEGSAFFHVASGNLGYQVEHHLFPDMPSTRYGEIAPKVRDVCKRYGLPYNTGPFSQAVGLGAADDPAARLPRRQAAAEARPVPGHRHRGRPGDDAPTGVPPRPPATAARLDPTATMASPRRPRTCPPRGPRTTDSQRATGLKG